MAAGASTHGAAHPLGAVFACTEGHEAIPRLARTKGLKTMVGAWISHDRERNEREIAR
jgi:GPH family glycoside/pentoside/hexuronide:cation symporter